MSANTMLIAGLAAGAALVGARHALHRGLTPTPDTGGLQPADLELPAREVWLPGAGGSRLFAWYLPAPSRAPGRPPALAPAVLLLIHGRQDATVPLEDARRLWAARGGARARLLELDGGHEGFDDPAQAQAAVLAFLRGGSV